MIASVLTLTRDDCKALRITDAYSIHRVVYDLFPDIRSHKEKTTSLSSGIQFVDKGGDFYSRHILILSNREPISPGTGTLSQKLVPEKFLTHEHYGFEIRMNPTKRSRNSGKTIAIENSALIDWFLDPKKEIERGFTVAKESLQVQDIGVQRFQKEIGTDVVHGTATFIGKLKVTDRQAFIKSFQNGLGRARAFGFGLLQLVPLQIQNATK